MTFFLSARFLKTVREYGILEDAYNRDFAEPVLALASAEVTRLTDLGYDKDDVVPVVNQALAAFVKRYPVSIPYIPF